MTVVVENDVAVAAVELPVRGWVHGHLVGAFNSPDLQGQSYTQTQLATLPPTLSLGGSFCFTDSTSFKGMGVKSYPQMTGPPGIKARTLILGLREMHPGLGSYAVTS